MTKALLIGRNLKRSFKKGEIEIPALAGVDLEVQVGETVAVVGASGAGKSTLLHILGTLEKPTSGEVIFEGKDLTTFSDKELAQFRNQNLGFVFQFHYLLPEFTALENVVMPKLIQEKVGTPSQAVKKRALELLDRVGLSQRIEHRPSELSGGEQQRVAIARALMNQPKLLLADELTGNLDLQNSQKIKELLLELNQDFKITILVVTHDQRIASSLGRCITLEDGRVLSSS